MPAPPPPPPAPTFNLGGGSADTGRGALLQSIRAGKALKKTVTVDKSGPAVSGRIKGEGSSSPSPNVNSKASASNTNVGNSINNGNPLGLGGLFSGGMPKLKPTGMRTNLAERDNGNVSSNTSSSPTIPSVKRGPPPVPPPAAQKPQIFTPASAQIAADSSSTNHLTEAPRSSFGKPTLAPKPPTMSPNAGHQKPSPPPKKLSLAPTNNSVSRAQSMRVPRSPAVLTPTPPSLHQSQDCLNEPQQRPMITRVLKAPGVRPPSPPTTRTTTNGIPIARVAPQPPCRAPSNPPPPPPLPHRSSSSAASSAAVTPTLSTSRLAPAVPPPPTPPTRGQSLQHQRNGAAFSNQSMAEFEARFSDMFHSIASFPAPEPFRGVTKIYNSKTVAATKQQAPEPPTRSVSTAGGAVGPRQHPQQQQQQQQQWQQQHNATSSAC